MRKIKLIVAYDGSNYAGWQVQANATAVQEVLQGALSDLAGEITLCQGAGRTDSGVHAEGQAAHFSIGIDLPVEKFPPALNDRLPHDIAVIAAEEVHPDFHAQRDAKWKEYRYVILNSNERSPFGLSYCYYEPARLDRAAMAEAARLFVGERDFAPFCGDPERYESTVRRVFVSRLDEGGDYLYYRVIGSGFLYNMVRAIVGTLLSVGRGNLSVADVGGLFETKERHNLAYTAAAKGLFLVRAGYDTYSPETDGLGPLHPIFS